MDHSQVIIRPVVSEKSYVLAAADKYTFRVHPDAHKTQIRQAVEALFDVKVVEVRTSSVKSKPKRLQVGMTVQSGPGAEISVGNCLSLASMPTGTVVHNLELQPGRGGQLGR